jgi:argininosuccinate lyase
MTPLDPAAPIAVTLTAAEWNGVLAALGEMPWRMAHPIIGRIVQQVQPPDPEKLPASPLANGDARHAEVLDRG